jgi:L-ascorbate metabolism protein UlaG (beta-lactamase superfamily)
MKITHFGHACTLIETSTARVLVDPGSFSSGFEDVENLDAIVITHQHADHVDVDRVPALVKRNPGVRVFADAATAQLLAPQDVSTTLLSLGDRLQVADTTIDVVGGTHAVIHPDIPDISNAGLIFDDGAAYHPGDALFVPPQQVDILLTPISGPWLRIADPIDFVRAVAPRVVVPIHEATLANPALHLTLVTNLGHAPVNVLPRGESVDV